MNFDELKQAWQEESAGELHLPHEMEQLKSALSPIGKIKKNMKFEMYFQMIGIVILGFYPIVYQLNSYLSNAYYMVYALLVLISVYYIWKFKLLFNFINQTMLNSKDNLYELYYEIKVNIEMYKSWCFATIPFGSLLTLILVFGVFKIDQKPHLWQQISEGISPEMWVIVISLVVFNIMVLTTLYFWIKYFYGKHLKQIKLLLQELKETETT